MSDNNIGEWTPSQVKSFILAILDERRVHIDERFRQIENNTSRADILLSQYKIDSNEYRTTFLPREEFKSEHRSLILQIETMRISIDQRLSFMDKERNLIKDDVISLKNLNDDIQKLKTLKDDVLSIKGRAGYINSTLLLSIIFGGSAILFSVIGYLAGR